jgi:hypothetical protein
VYRDVDFFFSIAPLGEESVYQEGCSFDTRCFVLVGPVFVATPVLVNKIVLTWNSLICLLDLGAMDHGKYTT